MASAASSTNRSQPAKGKRTRSSSSTSAPASKHARSSASPSTSSSASFLHTFASTNRFRLGLPSYVTLAPGADTVLFLRSSSSTSFIHDLFSLDLATNTERLLLTASTLLGGAEERLSAEEKAMRERMRLSGKGLQSFTLSPADPSLLLIPFAGQLHLFNRSSLQRTQLTHSSSPPLSPLWSPDGSMVAFVRDADIHVLDVVSTTEWQLTFIPSTSSPSALTNGLADFIAAEEMSRFTGLWWSPDSLHLVYQQTDTTGMERFHLSDPSDPSAPPHSFPYPRPGRLNASVRVGIAAVDRGKWVGRRSRGGSASSSATATPSHTTPSSSPMTPVAGGGPPPISIDPAGAEGDESLQVTSLTESGTGKVVFSPSSHSKRFHYKGAHMVDQTIWVQWDRERWPYLVQVVWADVQSELTVVVQSRDQREMAVLTCETISGDTRTLLIEAEPAHSWVNIDQSALEHMWVEGGQHFVWATERTGRWTVQLYDNRGQHVRQLVGEEVGYRSVAHVDAAHDCLYIHASPDPTQQHLVRVPLGLKGPTGEVEVITSMPGMHKCTIKRSTWPYAVHHYNSLTSMPRVAIRRLDRPGCIDQQKEVVVVKEVTAAMPFVSRTIIDTVKVPSSPLPLYSAVIPPADLEEGSGRLYPVLVSVYGGPHFQTVTQDYHAYLLSHFFASQGYYVVAIDNRGTPYRSRAFERAISGHLATVPVTDQVEGLQAVMARYPQMDAGRVGVWGWSFGGLMSALLCQLHPSTFHAGVAGAPVTQWLSYDTHYTERYLGMPEVEAEAYKQSSPMTYADRLAVPLMLLHGTSDDNVFFSHSLILSDALFREGKTHDFVPLINFTHLVSDPVVVTQLYTRITRFFQQHVKERKADDGEAEEDGAMDEGGQDGSG